MTQVEQVEILVDGHPVTVPRLDSLAAALLVTGHLRLGERRRGGAGRGQFCGMGVCHDCLVLVEGLGPVRACLTPVRSGMSISTEMRT